MNIIILILGNKLVYILLQKRPRPIEELSYYRYLVFVTPYICLQQSYTNYNVTILLFYSVYILLKPF